MGNKTSKKKKEQTGNEKSNYQTPRGQTPAPDNTPMPPPDKLNQMFNQLIVSLGKRINQGGISSSGRQENTNACV
jgi:hypothetical protein